MKRLAEGWGRRNDFGVKCLRMNSIAESVGWMGSGMAKVDGKMGNACLSQVPTAGFRVVPVEKEKQVPPLAVVVATDFGRNDRGRRVGHPMS